MEGLSCILNEPIFPEDIGMLSCDNFSEYIACLNTIIIIAITEKVKFLYQLHDICI